MNRLDISIKNTLPPERGRILLSEPFLMDDFFSRAVVLLCEHSNEGSYGFVLNNYSDLSFMDINPKFPDIPLRISIGGPVRPEHLYFLHTLDPEQIGGRHILDDLYLGGDFEMVLNMVQGNSGLLRHLRFFLGYSGWSPGQLNDELKENSWLVVPAPSTDILMDTTRENIWKDLMQSQGGVYKLISEFPLDPRMN
jgi:putative transcriptional regulator